MARKRATATPCDGCGHRPYCTDSGDTCPQFRVYLWAGTIQRKHSQVPDGVGVDDRRINTERAVEGLFA